MPGFFSAMDACMNACINGDVHNKSHVYSGTETSEEPSTRRGKSKGEETYRAYVESPARWGYAITMESEKYKQMKAIYEQMKAIHEQMKAIYEQMKAKYEQISAKCEEIIAKYEPIYAMKQEQTCEYNTSVYEQRDKNKTEFIDQGPLLEILTDNPVSTCVLHSDENLMEKCRMSRPRIVF
ncbi:hypothetical protein OS493_006871 [Desmophyllum pertusum]|uniref:Uncharacterized protein n=1 Tax=Desmophyllum pertusum TaxID=174260 RepID=A0A9W9ZS73_9CNID|nr:hypothetical protein OS493_006871 [Desmophyllum pertusum]